MSNYVSVTDFGAIGDGVTDNTAIIAQAMTTAAANSNSLFFPAGVYLTAPLTIPSSLARMFGENLGSILKLKRQAYSPGVSMIQCANNVASFQFETLSIDVNDASFNATQTFFAYGTNNLRLSNLTVTGSASNGILIRSGNNVLVRDVVMVGTNGGLTAAIFADNNQGTLSRMRVEDCAFSGVFTYGAELSNGDGLVIDGCRSNGNTGAGFAFGLSGAVYSAIRGCYSAESSHEAFQITNCSYCSIIGNHGSWATFGTDFGISINGNASTARFNKIVGNTIINSYSAGIALADWTQDTLVADNVLRDCGVRGTAAHGAGGQIAQMIAYTVTAGAVNNNNQVVNNTSISETGPTTYGFYELNLGAGAVVDNNFCKDNLIAGMTTLFLLAGPNSVFYDLVWRVYVPTVTAGSGTIGAYTVNSALYLLRGKAIELQLDISIPNPGSGANALIVSLPFLAAVNGGALAGREVTVSKKAASGVCSSTTAQIFLGDNSTPIANNSRIVVSGVFRIN